MPRRQKVAEHFKILSFPLNVLASEEAGDHLDYCCHCAGKAFRVEGKPFAVVNMWFTEKRNIDMCSKEALQTVWVAGRSQRITQQPVEQQQSDACNDGAFPFQVKTRSEANR